MAAAHPDSADLKAENRLLRQVIAEADRHLNCAAARLHEVLNEEAFVEETPMEVEAAMQSAAEAIAAASHSLQQSTARRSTSPMPGSPTRQQGQYLAFIHEYMLLNRGLAPTHREFQRFFNLTPPSVNSMLKRLDQKGFIRRTPGKPRAIEFAIDPERIPTLDRPLNH